MDQLRAGKWWRCWASLSSHRSPAVPLLRVCRQFPPSLWWTTVLSPSSTVDSTWQTANLLWWQSFPRSQLPPITAMASMAFTIASRFTASFWVFSGLGPGRRWDPSGSAWLAVRRANTLFQNCDGPRAEKRRIRDHHLSSLLWTPDRWH